MKSVHAPPKAAILIESMRDVGYTLESALADVVDNSITAGARTVNIAIDTTSPAVTVSIADDGRGMSREELLDAMRLGSRHPHEVRARHDLGRFGLGLKTASFSQCRRLTVVTRQAGLTSAATWDLDHVAVEGEWSLLVPETPDEIPFADQISADGALVVWENLDRALERDGSELARRHFVKRVDDARRHLELVFHRFLAGESGLPRVKILLNGAPLEPFDPFHADHPATIRRDPERVRLGDHSVEITMFTLPHHRNVTPADWDHYAGQAGYLKNQGFYLYREKRLIVHGTWFGIARQMELTKLARIRIDMPNGLDAEWSVDVKKAFARPPAKVRERLQRIITELGAPSRTIYTRRGRTPHDARLPIWERMQTDNEIVYRLNQNNPVVAAFRDQLSAEQQIEFRRLLEAIGAGLPMDGIFADLAGTPENVKGEPIPDESLRSLLETTYAGMITYGIRSEQIPQMLRVAEPFRSNWYRVEPLVEQIARDALA